MLVLGIITFTFLICIYFFLEYITPFSLKEELIDKKNITIGLVVGSILLGISLVLAAVVISI
jgi:uncharacterized membrane protein YjfL (UPF0719 family)